MKHGFVNTHMCREMELSQHGIGVDTVLLAMVINHPQFPTIVSSIIEIQKRTVSPDKSSALEARKCEVNIHYLRAIPLSSLKHC
jgi:hypothetical protein